MMLQLRLRSPLGAHLFYAALLVAGVAGCGSRAEVFGPGQSTTSSNTGTGGAGGAASTAASTVDVLLVIDNSRSMADKQQILGLAVPELVRSLANPRCVDLNGLPTSTQPPSAQAPCPAGAVRAFAPVADLHLGVITTSIGGHGADSCPATTSPMENDRAHLISRLPGGGNVATYQQLGFLAWDPSQQLEPPGEDDLAALVTTASELVLGAGQLGCGYEAQLESWYRFLVEPDPAQTIVVENDQAVLQGTDTVLLEQRQGFLRPDSLLAIVVLSDENDCSIRDGGQYFYAAQGGTSSGGLYHLPRAQSACESDPSDPCCRSCGQAPGDGCPPVGDECATGHDNLSDHVNLRCWDQKRRFGIDFLYPIDRYLTGLQATSVPDRDGDLVANPLFSDLDPSDEHHAIRDPGLIFLASIQGVPWQDIARRAADGSPDLLTGLDASGRPVGGFQSAAELDESGAWELIVGDPSSYYASASDRPTDPLMVESVDPRAGTHPVTGDALAPPGSGAMANPINGHEYDIPNRNDLQYACIFELPEPRDCTAPSPGGCDCGSDGLGNPLCQSADGSYGSAQLRAKAYPGLRQLELVRGLGPQGVVGSICPAQLANEAARDFGYVPTIRSLVDALRSRLSQP